MISGMGQLTLVVAIGVMNVDAVSTSTGFLSGTFTHNKFYHGDFPGRMRAAGSCGGHGPLVGVMGCLLQLIPTAHQERDQVHFFL
jgi:hypothetical protein